MKFSSEILTSLVGSVEYISNLPLRTVELIGAGCIWNPFSNRVLVTTVTDCSRKRATTGDVQSSDFGLMESINSGGNNTCVSMVMENWNRVNYIKQKLKQYFFVNGIFLYKI